MCPARDKFGFGDDSVLNWIIMFGPLSGQRESGSASDNVLNETRLTYD